MAQAGRSCPNRIAKANRNTGFIDMLTTPATPDGDELHAPVEQPIGPDVHQQRPTSTTRAAPADAENTPRTAISRTAETRT